MSDPPGLRLQPLSAWLSERIPGFDGSTGVVATLMAGGRSNVTYLIEDLRGAQCVLRRPPLGHVMPSAHDMAREYRVLSGLNRAGFPAPRVHALCEDPDVIGSTFMIMDYVQGRVFDTSERSRELDERGSAEVSAELVSTLVRLHDVDLEVSQLATLGRPNEYLNRQVTRWGQQWELTKTRDLVEVDELRDWLQTAIPRIPADLPAGLVHGDFRLDNTIFDPVRPEILAVLDWEMSTIGDPIADHGLALLYWSEPGDGLRAQVPVATGVTNAPGFWDRSQVVDAYARESGRSIDHLDECVALACFKMSVIMESIHFRNLSGAQIGTAASVDGDLSSVARTLAELGLAVTREGAFEGLRS